MDTKTIRYHFGVKKNDSEPLVSQLSRRIETFLQSSLPGTQFPAERVMAEALGISRVTVRNALVPFFHSGRILRQRRNGTVVAGKENKRAGELALGLPWNAVPPRRKLRFLCYETLPQQLDFWNNAVLCFNNSGRPFSVELIPAAEIPTEMHELQKFVESQGIDLLLYSPMFDQNYQQLVIPLPEDLQNICHDPAFIPQLFTGREKLCNHLLPVSFEFCHTMWNPELARKLGLKNVAERLKKGEKIRMISEVAEKLPRNVWAGSHVWCQLAYHGVQPFPEKKDVLIRELEQLAGVARFPRSFFTTQISPLDDVEKFVKKELLFLDAAYTQLQWVGMPDFEFCQIPCRQIPGSKLMMASVDIGITGCCAVPDGAAEFCRFLLTPEIQKSVESKKMVHPVRLKEFLETMKKQCGYSTAESRKLLDESMFFRDMSHPEELAQHFMVFEIRPELVQLFSGSLSPEKTADAILEKWRRFAAGRCLV